jgi:hypothetical protein
MCECEDERPGPHVCGGIPAAHVPPLRPASFRGFHHWSLFPAAPRTLPHPHPSRYSIARSPCLPVPLPLPPSTPVLSCRDRPVALCCARTCPSHLHDLCCGAQRGSGVHMDLWGCRRPLRPGARAGARGDPAGLGRLQPVHRIHYGGCQALCDAHTLMNTCTQRHAHARTHTHTRTHTRTRAR